MATNHARNRSVFKRVLVSESFLEKLFLLLATAILSGILIPYFTNKIQTDKARNEIVLQSQKNLLNDISKTLLTYETLLLDISWFKNNIATDSAMHEQAFKNYTSRSVDLLTDWRVESIKAKDLVSEDMSKKLDVFQLKMFKLQDSPMNRLHKQNGNNEEWAKLHRVNAQMLKEATDLISDLAKEIKITKSDLK
ncbi:hypothetical protein AAFN85_05015 [Mucilaginibacter sp. CAU 1740]|uniref:hypothetical protein n=1 Tax=Mucilaginibacter sp. CAU 1740 TaxID=3140365 RepID=UPI00325BC500